MKPSDGKTAIDIRLLSAPLGRLLLKRLAEGRRAIEQEENFL